MKPKKPIETLILNLRGQKVILDADLAGLYGVPTHVFNQPGFHAASEPARRIAL